MDELKLQELMRLDESELLEFKSNKIEPEKLGKYISALANSSAMLNKQFSYLIWGISDDKKIIGTNFFPYEEKINGGEPLISWLERNLDPRISIQFQEFEIESLKVVALIIHMTVGRPVAFKGTRYIRSGSSLKNLAEFPEKERLLWKSFEARTFEKEFALTNCSTDDLISLLDCETYRKMLNYPPESSYDELLQHMIDDNIIEQSGSGFNITNMGAYTFAKNLSNFEKLKSYAIRVIRYDGNNKFYAKEDITAGKGVAVGFEGLLNYIRMRLPLTTEIYDKNGQRIERTDYPDIVIREIVANQIVHQDFSISGTNPMIEIYDNRIEFTNPGVPINEPDRLLDLPPISRNEDLANLFRKMHLVESRGSGIDKIIITLESENLPAPDISAKGDNTSVTIFKRKHISEMNDKERVNAIFYHASILYVENDYMTNKTVRDRFGLTSKQSALATKIISSAVKSGKVKPYDENAGNKFMQYIPYYAQGYNE